MKHHFDYPLAVYVGAFADGTVARLSVGARKGKVDFDRARGLVCRMWREGVFPARCTYHEKWGVVTGRFNADDSRYRDEQYWTVPDRTDLIAGHVEHDGATIPDPHFDPLRVIEGGKRKAAAPLDQVLAAVGKLSWAELEALQHAIDSRLAA